MADGRPLTLLLICPSLPLSLLILPEVSNHLQGSGAPASEHIFLQTQLRSSALTTSLPILGIFEDSLLLLCREDLITLPTSSLFSFQGSWKVKFSLRAWWGRKGNVVIYVLLASLLAPARLPWGRGRLRTSFLLSFLPTGTVPAPSKGQRRKWALRKCAVM